MSQADYVLGLDLGVASIGWSAIRLIDGAPAGIVGGGSRIFESVANAPDIERGKEELRNAMRRESRMRRRQARRRARRLTKVAGILAGAGLLPSTADEAARQKMFDGLDVDIVRRHPECAADLPYFLRARALDQRMEAFELGRALYHLAQRRGFLSNRKAAPKDDKEEGAVREGISELRRGMADTGARSLGEYLSKIDPQQERIRTRYTDRKMYTEEFQQIWESQAAHHAAILTPDLRTKLYKAIFFQRPLRIRKDMVGECELERGRTRAPWALLAAQRFRYLQKTNDLRVAMDEWHDRDLTAEERAKVAGLAERNAKVTFAVLRKLLGLKSKINLERGGETRLIGNRTNAALREILGERWDGMSAGERDGLVEDWLSFVNDDALKRRAIAHWGMTEEQAEKYSKVNLESGYCGLSRQALAKLLPAMEAGVPYATAKAPFETVEFGEHEMLPPVQQALRALRNPIVERTLTEMRKVVNAVIRRYGKPAKIVVELGRDLKRGKGEREERSKQMRGRESERKKAEEAIQAAGVGKPSYNDVEKWLLAEECGWECPYTEKKISMQSLFGDTPQFDIEHIIPRGRSLDDSFANKTLCEVAENRNRKASKTPREAYGDESGRYEEIIKRVRQFKGDERLKKAKLRRFEMTEEELSALLNDFTEQQLNDTRYASKMAADYLGMLYGGRVQDGTQRIYVTSGQVTAMLRSAWLLNEVLQGPGEKKDRGDHRHHAVDAVAIALTEPKRVAELAKSAEMSAAQRKRKFQSLPGPFPDFIDKVRELIGGVVVSQRMNHVLRGPLHEETYYSRIDEQGRARRRVLVENATPGQIVDPGVREAVQNAAEGTTPVLKGGTRIKRVRVWVKSKFDRVGDGHRERRVIPGDNHHVEVVEEDGRWAFLIVTRLEATRRKAAKGSVVAWNTPGFVFSLSGGDTVELRHESGIRYWVLTAISQEANGRLKLIPAHLALQKAKAMNLALRPGPAPFQKMDPRKVQVDPVGQVFPAHD